MGNNTYISKTIINNDTCGDCPNTMYEKGNRINYGYGNIFAKTVIILTSFDTDKSNNILDLLEENYRRITGKELSEIAYVTRAVKCKKHQYDNISTNLHYCIRYLMHELFLIKPKKIFILAGDANEIIKSHLYYKFEYFIKAHNIQVFTGNNPGIYYYDNNCDKRATLEGLFHIM